jgi:hypothetical protein
VENQAKSLIVSGSINTMFIGAQPDLTVLDRALQLHGALGQRRQGLAGLGRDMMTT